MAHSSNTSRQTSADLLRFMQAVRSIQVCRGNHPWQLLDLTMPQLTAVTLLASTGGMRCRALADRMAIAPSAVTPLVDRLVGQKLAKREGDPDDRRIVWIRPTADAHAVHSQLLDAGQHVLSDVLRELPADARPDVRESIRLLADAAERVLTTQTVEA